jgi:alkanesulfonate monooxygenase SsuD/methylene tetrahydromethanopterin reductase-like flavin-dependent oxidoreductase (luciferase family)
MKPAEDAGAFREVLRQDLRAALKSRSPETISALRTTIAAIDNAEAVQHGTQTPRSADDSIAHSSPGVGSTEVPRRELTISEVHAIVRDLIGEYETQGEYYRSIRQYHRAESLERQADILRTYL